MPQYDSSINLQLPQVPNGVPDELYSYFAELYNAIGILRQAIDDNAIQAVNAWTPILNFGGAHVGMAFSVQQGVEILFGNKLVFIELRLTLTNKGASLGAALITGMNTPAGGLDGLNCGAWLNMGAGLIVPIAEITGANLFLFNFTGGTSAQVTDALFTNNSEIIISGVYRR